MIMRVTFGGPVGSMGVNRVRTQGIGVGGMNCFGTLCGPMGGMGGT